MHAYSLFPGNIPASQNSYQGFMPESSSFDIGSHHDHQSSIIFSALPDDPDPSFLDIYGGVSTASGIQYPSLQLNYTPSRPHPHPRHQGHDVGSSQNPPSPSNKRVPRPRNAFMIFRSAFWAEEKIARTVEHDHRHISRIIGHCWNEMSEEEKDVWRRKADQEKVEHEQKYPGYRFCPTARSKKPVKRKVKRNGADDLLRCKKVAELLLSGKKGDELTSAVMTLQPGGQCESTTVHSNQSPTLTSSPPAEALPCRDLSEEPPFRSPLLPPPALEDDSGSPTSSTESSPTGELFSFGFHTQDTVYMSHQYPHSPGPLDPKSTESALFQTNGFPPLAYSLYNDQPAVDFPIRSSFDIVFDGIPPSSDTYPRSFYNPFIHCAKPAVPPLPGPVSGARIRSEPVQWNTPYPFAT